MANPNLFNATSVVAKTAVQAIGTSATAIVTNSSSSNKVFKANALYISNVDTSNDATVNVDIYRSSTAYHITKAINVPAGTTLDVLNKPVYLEEGDALRLTASASSDLQGVCSYEEIS